MHIPRSRGGRTALVATVLGTVLLLVGGYLVLFDESSKTPTSAEGLSAGTQPFQPGEDEIPESLEDLVNPAKIGESAVTGVSQGAGNPFGNTAGDRRFHTVQITLRSDGAMYIGYRYRDKSGGLKIAERTLVVNHRVRGPLPVAQVAVQVLDTATFATCSIAIDGVTVTQSTARGSHHVAICTG